MHRTELGYARCGRGDHLKWGYTGMGVDASVKWECLRATGLRVLSGRDLRVWGGHCWVCEGCMSVVKC